MEKNTVVTIFIEDMTEQGEGIGHADGYTLFVKDTVIGDVAEVKVVKAKKTYGYGRLMRIVKPSPDRVEPRCPVAAPCGGCQLQAMSYAGQLAFKRRKVENHLQRLGGFNVWRPEAENDLPDGGGASAEENSLPGGGAAPSTEAWASPEEERASRHHGISVNPVIGMEDPWHYRNKCQVPVRRGKDGRILMGFYAGRTHSVIETEHCFLGDPVNEQILGLIRDHMAGFRIEPYDEETGRGLVRHVLIRIGRKSGEIMVCIVINGPKLPHADLLVRALRDIPGMTSVTVNINREKSNVILGKELVNLFGPGYITDLIGDLRYRISPLSFFQVNPRQTEILYRTALEYAGLTGDETVWDLYCGTGTISLFLARAAKKVYGVEIIPAAVENAKANAKLNGIDNAEFFVGKAEEVFPEWCRRMRQEEGAASGEVQMAGVGAPGSRRHRSEAGNVDAAGSRSHRSEAGNVDAAGGRGRLSDARVDVIVVDPPRKGCDETLLSTILSMAPSRIVYVSCDSATLARDLKQLCAEGAYAVERVQPVDMFPQTVGIETVCLLSKLSEAKNHISVKVEMDEMDVSAAESKATYQEIQGWVQEKYGFHVTNLNIAQVKRKHGIIERENYNKAKSPDTRQPGCPEEKERAIEEAMRYFQMISS